MNMTVLLVGAFAFISVILWMLVSAGNNRRY